MSQARQVAGQHRRVCPRDEHRCWGERNGDGPVLSDLRLPAASHEVSKVDWLTEGHTDSRATTKAALNIAIDAPYGRDTCSIGPLKDVAADLGAWFDVRKVLHFAEFPADRVNGLTEQKRRQSHVHEGLRHPHVRRSQLRPVLRHDDNRSGRGGRLKKLPIAEIVGGLSRTVIVVTRVSFPSRHVRFRHVEHLCIEDWRL